MYDYTFYHILLTFYKRYIKKCHTFFKLLKSLKTSFASIGYFLTAD